MQDKSRISLNFKALKEEYQKELFMQFIINLSSKKIEELETIKSELEKEKRDMQQSRSLTRKLSNLLSKKIDELEGYNENLQRKIESKTKQVIKAERLAAMGELASRLAHDMRNPLSIIKGVHEIMKVKNPNPDKNTQEQYLRIDRAISRMSHQLDDVLDFVRIKPLQFSIVSINEILDSVTNSIKLPEKISIEKTVDDTSLLCDARGIEIVFINLITNAIQAIGEKGKIRIRIIKQEDWLVIEVEDDGSGIPNDILPKIFEPLFTTKQSGTGLGLSSCKNIIEQHGGTITVRNKPTTFLVKLPLKSSSAD